MGTGANLRGFHPLVLYYVGEFFGLDSIKDKVMHQIEDLSARIAPVTET